MNSKQMRRILVTLSVCALPLAGCSDSGGGAAVTPPIHITGSGTIVSETRPVAPFHSLDMGIHAEVRITQGTTESVRIETDDNIIGHIDTIVVDGGVLTIDTTIDYTTLHGVLVTIEMVEIRSLQLSGVGSITGENSFVTTALSLTNTGVGNITVTGTTQTLNVTHRAVGSIDARYLPTNSATVVSEGIGDCWVYTVQVLDATLTGSGNVYYYGNPAEVFSSVTGSGRLIPR